MVQRLDTAFSRALLDGKAGIVVDAAVLEQTLQQQLLHGGTLDTLLLELGLLDEAQVQQALSAAWGTQPVDVASFEDPDPAASKLLPERMAVALGTAPLYQDGHNVLHVGVRSPFDKGLVDEVAALIRVKVTAHVVPEVRVWQALHKAYGTPLDERFLALLRTLAPETSATSTTLPPAPQKGSAAAAGDDAVVSWDLVEAMAHLAAQDSRDGIARVATSFARRFLPFAAVFGVRADSCVGWHRQGPAEGALFSSRPFGITPDCVLHPLLAGAQASPSPYLGKPPLNEANAAFFGWLGRRRPKSILLVPIVVARRPVACLFADGGIRPRDPRELGELTAFGARLGPAFEALLRQRHRQHPSLFPQPASTTPGDPGETDASDAIVGSRDTHAGQGAAIPPPLDAVQMPQTTTSELPSAMPGPMPLVPAPPASSSSMSSSPPTPALGSRAALEAPEPRRDGTSPFARTYVKPPPAPSIDARSEPSPDDDDVTSTPIVLSGIGTPLLDERLAARLHGADGRRGEQRDRKSTLFAVDDTLAPAVWQGALAQTVEQGLQGGSVTDKERILAGRAADALDEDGSWEDVVYDPTHAKDLEAAAPQAARADRVDLSFPELSSSTLAGLYGEEDDGDDDDDDKERATAGATTTTTTRDPPLSTLSHKDLVELLFAGDDDLVGRASRELVSRGLACVPALSERFPGRLRVDPFDAGENVRSADRTGPLVDVLARLGPDGLDAAIPHVDSRYPAHRFAAVLLFSLTPDVRAIDLLRARLHDQEPRIRELAAEALMPFLAHPRFEALLVHLRERTSTSTKPYPVEARRRAVQLLGQFRDVGAVPLLIALLGQHPEGGELAEDTRRALRNIALADFGNRPKGWEKWWARAKKRSRLDWLIDALASEELELRQDAHRELASLAGDDFGYRPDADKRSRQRAIEVWQQWWTEEKARSPHPAAAART